MRHKTLLLFITTFCLAHGLVDAACAAVLFAIDTHQSNLSNLYLFILIYDVIAFSTQPFFGLLVDKYKAPAQIAALGTAMVATSTLMMGTPLLAAVTAGIGNAFFHVGGGSLSLDIAPGKATLPGIFVAPGALGLTIGILIGKSGSFVAWPFFLLLLGSTALILAVPRQDAVVEAKPYGNLRWFETAIALLFLSIAIRSLVGQSLILPWKSSTTLLLALTLAAVLGKALGGMLADRYGWGAIALTGLVISAPLLAFFAPAPAMVIAGTFLFNLSMPVTLVCMAEMLPGKSGFAFGLTALALIAGALPAFLPLHALTGAPGFIFTTILVSIAALFFGLRLYRRYFDDRMASLQQGAQFKEK